MEREADTEGGPPPDLMSYTAAIRAHEGVEGEDDENDLVAAARGLLRRLKARGLVADAPVYNALLRVCAQRGQWRTVGDVLSEMAREAGLAPDEWTVRALTSAPAATGRVGAKERGQALAFLRRLQDEGEERARVARRKREREGEREKGGGSWSPSRRTAVARVRGSGSGRR